MIRSGGATFGGATFGEATFGGATLRRGHPRLALSPS